MNMRAEGLTRVRPAPLPRVLSAHLKEFKAEYQSLRPGLQAYLDRYHQEKFILLRETQERVIPVLEGCLPRLEKILGDSFLGLSLGGSLILGLGTPTSSDVDFFIHTIASSLEQERAAVKHVFSELTRAELRPCSHVKHPLYNFGEGGDRLSEDIVSVFANYFVGGEANSRLLEAALQRVEELLGGRIWIPSSLSPSLGSLYFDILGAVSSREVVAQYFINMHELEGRVFFAGLFMDFLREEVSSYRKARKLNFPFPPELEEVLGTK